MDSTRPDPPEQGQHQASPDTTPVPEQLELPLAFPPPREEGCLDHALLTFFACAVCQLPRLLCLCHAPQHAVQTGGDK